MKADLSRNTFDPAYHFSSVRLQQGRIVTDADWNEQADITRHRSERQARDIIGPCGAPLDAAGYAITATTNALAVRALNANVAWIAAEDGVLLVTTNGGSDWTLANVDTVEHLRAVTSTGNTGWVVGDRGVVRRTSDAGQTWLAQDAGTFITLRGVNATDADHVWAVGDNGVVVRSVDAGVTWLLSEVDSPRLHAVQFIDALNGVAVGQAGSIVSTRDGGETWSVVASGTNAHLTSIARFGTTRLWVAGYDGTIVRSEDGGVSWFTCATPSTVTLRAIAFRDNVEGWAVGEEGTVLHSTDGGATWQADASTHASGALRGVALFGDEPGWVVGDRQAAFRIGGGSPDVSEVLLPAVSLGIEPGVYYINGTLCEIESRCSYVHQPDGGAGERLGPGAYLLYLDVWQHHMSSIEAPWISEVALGGPDTATRARTVAQVRALPLPLTSPFEWSCGADVTAWNDLVSAQRPRLAARAEPQLASTTLCEIAATAGYRRLENQLYRVEVHEGGGSPTFKWSRENGSVTYAVLSVQVDTIAQQTIVRVAARGRDKNLDIAVHDQLELIDDDATLTTRAGTMLEYIADGDDELELVLAGVPDGMIGRVPSRHPVLRRWDHKPAVAGTHVLPIVADTWIELEEGVQVRFESGGHYRCGDYWQIPARTITSNVEWPRDENGDPIARAPAGIADSYCRLAVVEVDTEGSVIVHSDCREWFPPLTAMEQLLYVSGDGQHAAPNVLLHQPLIVRVARGGVPLQGATIRFEVETGGGLVGPGSGGSQWQYETTTDIDGQASSRWTLGPGATGPARFQRVRASLVDRNEQPVEGQIVVFCATTARALQYISGDGQQAPPNGNLPHVLQARATDGTDGIAGVVLTATIESGGGAIIGASTVTTAADGYASFGWRVGASGAQRLAVRVADSSNNTQQRLEYTATVTQPSAGGGGCEVTIGRGGEHERLTSELLRELLERNRGAICVCFLPGEHEIDELEVRAGGQNNRARLCLHSCGPTARIRVRRRFTLSGFEALELSDLNIELQGEPGVSLSENGDVRLSGLTLMRPAFRAATPALIVADAASLQLERCDIGAVGAPAAVIDRISGDCHIVGNQFRGPLSFYGEPGRDLTDELRDRLINFPNVDLRVTRARLRLMDNSIGLLTIGERMARQLLQLQADGLFQAAVVHGNTFEEMRNLFACGMLSVSDNSFVSESDDGGTPYGLMVATRATATGNIAVHVSDAAILHFFTGRGAFSGAANQIFTMPNA